MVNFWIPLDFELVEIDLFFDVREKTYIYNEQFGTFVRYIQGSL